MRKMFFLMLTLIILSVVSVKAQVTMGSQADPHAGAVLDLQTNGNHGGFLLPHVVLTSATVWAPLGGTATNGMMVFNTSTSTANDLTGTGVYYWMNGKWTMAGSGTVTLPAFVCGNALSDIEGNTYRTKLYGSMCVMIDNLKTKTARDGTLLGYSTDVGTYTNTSNGYKYCAPNLNPSLIASQGALYDQKSAGNVCPTGWKVPSRLEWQAFEAAGAGTVAEINANWINQSYPGFVLVGAVEGTYGEHAYWWTSTSAQPRKLWRLDPEGLSFYTNVTIDTYFFSVRCMKE